MIRVGDLLEEFREKPDSHDLPVLTLTEKQGFVLQSERFKKRLATEDTSKYKVVRRDDIAFNPYLLWAGAIAQNTIVDAGVISPLYPTFRVKEGFNPQYVGRLLLSEPLVRAYDQIAFGSVPRRRRSSVRDFLALPLATQPELDDQRRIADILDKADALRAKRQKVLDNLDALTQSIFRDMFAGRGLPLRPYGELVSNLRNGLSPSVKGSRKAEVLTLAAITGDEFRPDERKVGTFFGEPPNSKKVAGDMFLVCRGSGNPALAGRGVISTEFNGAVFPDTVIAGDIIGHEVLPLYLQTVWRMPEVRSQIEMVLTTTNGTYKINQAKLAEILVPVASFSEQELFVEAASRAQRVSVAGREELATLSSLNRSLAARAFAGSL